MKAVAWGRLLRLSLAPSAAADALAGMTLGAWGAFPLDPRAALLPLASLCVFHGGMALNDWADRREDARTRPDRPIPSGAVSASGALLAALALLIVGPLLATIASPAAGTCLAGVALTAALYDVAGRGPRLGPTLLGLCRGGNLAAGVVAGAALSGLPMGAIARWAWLMCGLYALYVAFASRLARLEDIEDERELGTRPARALRAAATCLALAPWTVMLPLGPDAPGSAVESGVVLGSTARLLALFSIPFFAILAMVSAYGLLRVSREGLPWSRGRVGRAAGMALRRLLVFTAVAAACVPAAGVIAGDGEFSPPLAAWIVAPVLLLGYPIALRLRRVFPPT